MHLRCRVANVVYQSFIETLADTAPSICVLVTSEELARGRSKGYFHVLQFFPKPCVNPFIKLRVVVKTISC